MAILQLALFQSSKNYHKPEFFQRFPTFLKRLVLRFHTKNMIARPSQNRSARGQKSLHLFAVKSPRMRGGCEVQLRYRRCLRWGMLWGLEEHGFAARNGKQSLVVRCLFVTKPLLVDPSISQFQFRSINCTSSMSNVAFATSISQ